MLLVGLWGVVGGAQDLWVWFFLNHWFDEPEKILARLDDLKCFIRTSIQENQVKECWSLLFLVILTVGILKSSGNGQQIDAERIKISSVWSSMEGNVSRTLCKKKRQHRQTIRWEGLFWLARKICWFGGKEKKFLSWEEPFKWSHISPLTMGNEAGKTRVNGQKSFMGFHLKQMPQAGEQVRLSSVLQSCLTKWLGSGWIELGDLHHSYILSPDTTHLLFEPKMLIQTLNY